MKQTKQTSRKVLTKAKPKKFTSFQCKVCKKQFSDKAGLTTHTAIHHPANMYKCTLCNYESNIKKYLSRHVKKVHATPIAHKCNVCEKMFHYKCNLLEHMRVHTGEKPYKCKDCGKAFNSSYSLSTHVLIHKDVKPFECSFCQYACRDSSTLRKHEARHTGTLKVYQCKLCNKTFDGRCKLKEHLADEHLTSGENRHPCELCGGLYKTKATLTNHIQSVHLKAKSCICSICGVHISNASNLKAHLSTHVDARPYRCRHAGCNNRYKDMGSVKKHSLIHFPDMQYACKICNRKFTRKCRLNKHILQHVPKKKTVICDYCGVGFYNKKYLTNHIERKHGRKGQRYECDICGLVTTNKPSIVMHLKHGHRNDKDIECKICHTLYKKHMYLKLHYLKSHDIRYKMKKKPRHRKISISVKVEPADEEDTKEIDILEIEKEEVIEPKDIKNPQEFGENKTEISDNNLKLPQKVTEKMFEEFFEKNVEVKSILEKKAKSSKNIIKGELKYAKQYLDKLLVKVRRRKKVEALEETRQQYNERMRAATMGKKEKVSIRYFNNNKVCDNNDKDGNESLIDTKTDENESLNDNANNNDSPKEYVKQINKETNGKIKLNTHQCYICFKLFKMKTDLIEHCKEHFDICNETTLKKCPLCSYVTELTITRHMKLIHNLNIKVFYGKVNDKTTNKNGSRYSYNINNKTIKELEIIPSVKLLNKRASMMLDKEKKQQKDSVIGKTKLVRKGKEWIVETDTIKIDEKYILPEINEKDIDLKLSDNYLDKLKNLYRVAKKNNCQMLFPCEKCDKICQTLSALKLHWRKHETNPKPYKKKVWQHKTKNVKVVKVTKVASKNEEHRHEKPQPIKNKHKCDQELKDFYENNIKGGNIEFWQFLKIYNKMCRENIEDFKDLENRTDFGIHTKEQNLPKKVSVKKVKNYFIRTIMISKREHIRRLSIIRKMRDDIARKTRI